MRLVSAEYTRVTGLGNKLFPWARAKVFALRNDCKMLQSRWISPRAGAITRGGIDYRFALTKIWLAGNFRRDGDELSILEYLRKCRHLPIRLADDLADAAADMAENQHVMFRWNTCHNFTDLVGQQGYLRKRLSSVAMPSQLRFAQRYDGRDFIALNVRTGKDFVSRSSGRSGYYLTEKDWFVGALTEARRRYGQLPAIVVSDGGRAQLQGILNEPNVELLQAPTAIADLLVLSKARVLLGSGNSSFSAWASYLGEMDTFSSKETPFSHFMLGDGRGGTQVVGTLL
jgi:hypothetical protein